MRVRYKIPSWISWIPLYGQIEDELEVSKMKQETCLQTEPCPLTISWIEERVNWPSVTQVKCFACIIYILCKREVPPSWILWTVPVSCCVVQIKISFICLRVVMGCTVSKHNKYHHYVSLACLIHYQIYLFKYVSTLQYLKTLRAEHRFLREKPNLQNFNFHHFPCCNLLKRSELLLVKICSVLSLFTLICWRSVQLNLCLSTTTAYSQLQINLASKTF